MPATSIVLSLGMTIPIRPYIPPKSSHHQYDFDRAMDIFKGHDAGMTFTVLAKRHQVTPQRISQIYGQVMRRGGIRWLGRGLSENG